MIGLRADLETYYQEEKIKTLLSKLFLVLNNLSQQIEMILCILNNEGTKEDILNIHERFVKLEGLRIKANDESELCYKILQHCVSYLLTNLLLELHKVIQHLFQMKGVFSDETKSFEIQIMVNCSILNEVNLFSRLGKLKL